MLKNLRNILLQISVITLIITSCSLIQNPSENPGFMITKPEVKEASSDNLCSICGVYFDLYNNSDKAINNIEISMNIYDKKTKLNICTGLGTIKSSINSTVLPNKKKTFCIPLDKYIVVADCSDLLVDQFYLSAVVFSDGSVWKDNFGIYATSSE